MPTNNFKLFDENKANMMTDQEYNIAQQRLNGVQSGVASSQLQNKTLYQTALMCYALSQLMAANGYDANDADAVSTFVNNLSNTFLQKVLDKANSTEAKNGTVDYKFMTPKGTRDSIQLFGEVDPTENTVGYICQIYTNTKTERSFICSNIVDGKYSWTKIPKKVTVRKTEIITESETFIVPATAKSLDVRLFGGGGGKQSGADGGGGGGYMAHEVFDNLAGESVEVTIGTANRTGNGNATSFGKYLTAQGGGASLANESKAGSGGTGGGGVEYNGRNVNGGDGDYGGGGGGAGSDTTGANAGNGGNGGTYGGGGGGGGRSNYNSVTTGGNGGTYGGKGGDGAYSGVAAQDGSDGIDTTSLNLEFTGEGKGGKVGSNLSTRAVFLGGGGGGGYGGNGGKSGSVISIDRDGQGTGGGGGGGYGADGGNGPDLDNWRGNCPGGGGGGYGGNGDDAKVLGSYKAAGGGGGYGPSNYGKGLTSSYNTSDLTIPANNGVCILIYEYEEIQ